MILLRMPGGIAHEIKVSQFDAFIELVPTLQIEEETLFVLGSALGVRYFFQ